MKYLRVHESLVRICGDGGGDGDEDTDEKEEEEEDVVTSPASRCVVRTRKNDLRATRKMYRLEGS